MEDYKVQWHKYNMDQVDLFSTTFYSLIFESRNNCSQKGKLFFYSTPSKHSRTHSIIAVVLQPCCPSSSLQDCRLIQNEIEFYEHYRFS